MAILSFEQLNQAPRLAIDDYFARQERRKAQKLTALPKIEVFETNKNREGRIKNLKNRLSYITVI